MLRDKPIQKTAPERGFRGIKGHPVTLYWWRWREPRNRATEMA